MANSQQMFWVLVILLGSFLLGCAGGQNESLDSGANKFSIYPSEISLDQKITVKLPKQHPLKMSIRDPKGVWHWVQDAEEDILFLPYSDFKEATRITILPSQVRGVSWINGKRLDGLVFNHLGEYLVYIADNLETEPENTFHFMGKVVLIK